MNTLKLTLAALCLTAVSSCGNQTVEKTEDSENAVIENIMSRRSIRQYKPEQVARETLDKIMECGINAPSAINNQAWEVRVINDPAVFEEIKGYMVASNPDADPAMVTGCFRGAPTMVVVAKQLDWGTSPFDCGLLAENIMLSAKSLGVGSVCLGSPIGFINNSPQVLEKLAFSPGYEPLVCIGLGYPAEDPEAKPRDFSKVKYVE